MTVRQLLTELAWLTAMAIPAIQAVLAFAEGFLKT